MGTAAHRGPATQRRGGAVLLGLLAGALAAGCASREEVAPTIARGHGSLPIAEGTYLFLGSVPAGHQPDGNSVMLRGLDGWIVFDTGRSKAHARRLLGFARDSGAPVGAIVNSHWHLDHTSGNRMLREAYPDAPVFASSAIVGALPGPLAGHRQRSEAQVASGVLQEPLRSEVLRDIATITDAGALLPTETVSRAKKGTIAGRKVEVGLAAHAVTAGDLWLYDPDTRVLLAGDLVTLPVPLFDTACPEGWQEALSALRDTDFALLVPGHGAPMGLEDFLRWREGFDGLLECAAGDAPAEACAAGWFSALGPMVRANAQPRARERLRHYVADVLRGDDGRARRHCPADTGWGADD